MLQSMGSQRARHDLRDWTTATNVLKHYFPFTPQNYLHRLWLIGNSNHWGFCLCVCMCVNFTCQKTSIYLNTIRKAHCNLHAPWNYFPRQKVCGPHGHAHFEWRALQTRAKNLQNAKQSESPRGNEAAWAWVMWDAQLLHSRNSSIR